MRIILNIYLTRLCLNVLIAESLKSLVEVKRGEAVKSLRFEIAAFLAFLRGSTLLLSS